MVIVLILGILIAASAVWILSPFQDRSSAAYREWERDRQDTFAAATRTSAAIFSSEFKFDSVELVHIGPGKAYFSWWGHLLLRLRGSGKTPDEDLALSILADFSDYPVNRWKAGFGGYTPFPKLDIFRAYEVEYFDTEGRFMRRIPLKSTEESRHALLEVLREWVRYPDRFGTYKFFSVNCVGLMDALLVEARIFPRSLEKYPIWPWDLRRLISEAGVLDE